MPLDLLEHTTVYCVKESVFSVVECDEVTVQSHYMHLGAIIAVMGVMAADEMNDMITHQDEHVPDDLHSSPWPHEPGFVSSR